MKYYYNDMELNVAEDVYCPREDSELLAATIEKLSVDGKAALEMGCGSGLLSILLAKKGARVTAADVNESAVRITEENAAANGVKIRAIRSDLFAKIKGKFDLMVFNPPYLPDESDDLTYSGGPTGRELIERFASAARSHLAQGGKILLLISSLTGEKEVEKLLLSKGFLCNAIARKKVPWEELLVIEIR